MRDNACSNSRKVEAGSLCSRAVEAKRPKVAKVVKQAKRPPVRSCRNVAGLAWRVSEIATKPARKASKGKPLLPREGQGPMENPLERRGCFPAV